MDFPQLIEKTILFVKDQLQNYDGGHDWFHIERVYNNALLIGKGELCDLKVVKLGALLHDVGDSKFHEGDKSLGPTIVREFLERQQLAEIVIQQVVSIIENISFRGGKSEDAFSSIELKIVQDADRLDAIGAIGIARAFSYGGFKNRLLYDPSVSPNLQMSTKEYQNSTAPTINHFYEKLLLLKDKMNTETGKKIAGERHLFMENYLAQFFAEWDGSK